MGCWSEQSIEHAAIRIVSGERPPEIEELIAHAGRCMRCGELLALFEGLERGLRWDLPGVRVFRLVGTRTGGDRRADWPVASASVEYDIAAETAKTNRINDITLRTEDGAFVVRIFLSPTGEGAHAVLVSASEEPVRMSLRIGDRDYPFDPSGTVEIPRFGSEIHLVAF